jgi:hypothetical protein
MRAELRSGEDYPHHLATAVAEVTPFYPEAREQAVEVRISNSRRVAGYFREPPRPGRPAFIYITKSVVRGDPVELRGILAHEFGHLLQYGRTDWPAGEKACDLIWLSRCGAAFPRPPSYLRIGRWRRNWGELAALAQDLAQQAWRMRREGVRTYIKWWEQNLQARALSLHSGTRMDPAHSQTSGL